MEMICIFVPMGAVKPNKEIIVDEILTEIDFGSTYTECLALNSTKWQLTSRTFVRYWNEATARFQAMNERTRNALEAVRIDLEKERLKSKIMDKYERMEKLSEIARQELKFAKEVPTKFGPQEILAIPDYADIKAAIAELNKMDGEYAPVKKDITSAGEAINIISLGTGIKPQD